MTIQIPVTQEAIDLCSSWLENHSMAKRGVFDGDKEKQFTGLLGESIFHHYVFGEYPKFVAGFDSGFDIIFKNNRIDVKTMRRNVFVRDYFVNNFTALQLNLKCDVLMFLSYNKKEQVMEICGWIYKSDLDTKSNLFKAGTERKRSDGTSFIIQQDTYEIPNTNLNPFRK